MILNLQSNALKFTNKGKITIVANQLLIKNEEHIEISVIDTGIGIKTEDFDKLFKMFGYIQDSQ